MIYLLIVSHSAKIAQGTLELAREMGGHDNIIAVGGAKDGSLGADFDATRDALSGCPAGSEVIVLTDMGSTYMTAQMAIEAMPADRQSRIRLSDAALVEGAMVVSVAIASGLGVDGILGQLDDFLLEKE